MRLLKIAHQQHGAFTLAADPEVDADLAAFCDFGIDAGDLHADGQHLFQIHQDCCPGKAFTLKERVEKLHLLQNGGVGRFAQAGFISRAFSHKRGGFRLNGL